MTKIPSSPLLIDRKKWYRFADLTIGDHGEITARLQMDAASLWFCGHFPGNPILPGIAQLALVIDAIGQASDATVRLKQINRVRFKRPIRPGESIEIRIRPDGHRPSAYTFLIDSGGQRACSGRLETVHES